MKRMRWWDDTTCKRRLQGVIVTDINENQSHSRPSRVTLLIAVALVVGIVVIVNWAEISAFAHIPQIKRALGF
jgi:hypothetical protein